jgi:hypothetical protein
MLYTAFILGLVGSLHCGGMCAPLALALPYNRAVQWLMLRQALLYNAGRIAMYVGQGLCFGFLGSGLSWAIGQQFLSIFLGSGFVAVAVLKWTKPASLSFQTGRVQKWLALYLKRPNAFFVVGLLNGLLPCGLVWWAIAAATLTFNTLQGGLYMLFFGLGTLPMMLGLVVASHSLRRSFFQRFLGLIPAYQLVLGLFLIWRGLTIQADSVWLLQAAPICH